MMSTPEGGSFLKRTARRPFAPALEHIDARFDALFNALTGVECRLTQEMQALHLQQKQHHDESAGWINFWGQRQERLCQDIGAQIRADVQTAIQTAAFAERTAEEAAGALEIIEEQSGGKKIERRSPSNFDGQHTVIDRLLSHEGPIARDGLWFNPPVVLRRNDRNRYAVDQIHERIVEIPFVFRSLSGLPADARVLDVGSAESTVAFSLAAMGFKTTAMDQRGYPLRHANLENVTDNIARWGGPGANSLDAIICLSTLEHLGLKAYGTDETDENLDRKMMPRFQSWLKPGGLFVLTAPYGRRAASDFERTYDRAQIDDLMAGWTVKERVVFAREGATEWKPRTESPETWPEHLRGVVMIAATKA